MENLKHTFILTLICFAFSIGFHVDLLSSIKISSVKAGNNQEVMKFRDLPLDSKDPVKLSFNENYLIFSIEVNPGAADDSIYYQLEGLDYSWMSCAGCNQIQYAHLDGGDYTLYIKSGLSDEEATKYSFIIEGNILHKWWFIPMLALCFIILLSVLVYFFSLYSLRQQLREQQIIQREKLSSMVDLTTGVAHEIQNPLNFVNNFSEVSIELLEEVEEEIENESLEDIKELTGFLTENVKKINEHGNRASKIIKSMLDHSKPGTGQREIIDLNNLLEEYAHRALLNAQSKYADINIEFDKNLENKVINVNVVPQDIGRVFNNILSNAFYAVAEKASLVTNDQMVGEYVPKVTISSVIKSRKVSISISDNGNGMPDNLKEKIFQPFFTTKPTGEGTGLGLSLSYDIIKAHGGELSVESEIGVGSTFKVVLPK